MGFPSAGAALAAPGARPILPAIGSRIVGVSPGLDFALGGEMCQWGMLIGAAPGNTARVTLNGKDVPLATDERFLIAFDRNAGPIARLAAVLSNGRASDALLAASAPSAFIAGKRMPIMAALISRERSAIRSMRQRTASSFWRPTISSRWRAIY